MLGHASGKMPGFYALAILRRRWKCWRYMALTRVLYAEQQIGRSGGNLMPAQPLSILPYVRSSSLLHRTLEPSVTATPSPQDKLVHVLLQRVTAIVFASTRRGIPRVTVIRFRLFVTVYLHAPTHSLPPPLSPTRSYRIGRCCTSPAHRRSHPYGMEWESCLVFAQVQWHLHSCSSAATGLTCTIVT